MFSLLIACTVCTGMLAGVIAAWLYFRPLRVVLTDRVETRDRRLGQMDAEIKAARGQIDAIQKENTALTAREAELAATLDHERQAAAERLSTARKTAEERLSAIEQATGRSLAAAERAAAERLLASEKASADQIVAVKSAAEERFTASQTAAQEKLALLEEARQKLSDAFQALSSEALKSNNQAFLQLAKETLEKHQVQAKGDLESRQKAIEQIVKPLAESIQEMERNRAGAYEGLSAQVRAMAEVQTRLQAETGHLVSALRTPQVRGRWGEIQLQRVVELAGMVERCDFDQQPSARTEDGRLRPDLIVRLPLGKSIVVDAKVPLKAYLEAVEAPDDATRALKLKEHARQLRAHMDCLAGKSYWEQFQPTPEFVVMFLPGESVFSAALQQDPALLENGPQQGVILATPTTLIALLKAVAYGWRQEAIAENAQRIADLAKKLNKNILTFHGHFADLQNSLNRAVTSFDSALGSLETRVMPTARKLQCLEGGSPPEIEVLEGVGRVARVPRATSVELGVPA